MQASGSRGHGWVTDTTGIVNLAARIGAEGLRILAKSGVEVHTIESMVLLCRLTSVTHAFRQSLHDSRRAQIGNTLFIAKLVQIGGCTNYVVDEFLCTSAGENVLALMTSIISVLDADQSARVFIDLFSHLKVPPDGIPGLAQLRAIRSVVAPLSRQTDFKDQVAGMHSYIHAVTNPDTLYDVNRLREVAPTPSDMAVLITTLYKVHAEYVTSQPPVLISRRVFCFGLRGAAWIAVYSRLLGLPVCLISAQGAAVPITSTFNEAAVILCPAQGPRASMLQDKIKPSDIIQSAQPPPSPSPSWLLQCGPGKSDVLSRLLGCHLGDTSEIGSVVFTLAAAIRRQRLPPSGPLSKFNWEPFYSAHPTGLDLETTLRLLGLPGAIVHLPNLDTYVNPETGELRGAFVSRLNAGIPPPRRPRKMWSSIINRLATLAECLSLTDWAISSGQISIHALESPEFERICLADGLRPGDDMYYVHLSREIVRIIAGPNTDSGLAFHEGVVGINVDGTLLVDRCVVENTLRPGPIFLVRHGTFSVHDDESKTLRCPIDRVLDPWTSLHSGDARHENVGLTSLSIRPLFREFKVEMWCSHDADSIQLHHCARVRGVGKNSPSLSFDVDVVRLIRRCWVAQVGERCGHDPGATRWTRESFEPVVPGQEVEARNLAVDEDGVGWMVHAVPVAMTPSRDGGAGRVVAHLYPLALEREAQWAALGGCDGGEWVVLQGGRCLDCFARDMERYRGEGHRASVAVVGGWCL